MTAKLRAGAALLLAASLFLTACGGNSGNESASGEESAAVEAENADSSDNAASAADASSNGGSDSQSAASPQLTTEGFLPYTHPASGFSLEYPANWIACTATASLSEEEHAALAEVDIDESVLDAMLTESDAVFINMDASDKNTTANLTFNVSPQPGMTQSALVASTATDEMADSLEAQFSSIYSDFRWLEKPVAIQVGENAFLYYAISYSYEGVAATMRQAMTVHDENVYAFYYVAGGSSGEDTFLSILSTVTFANAAQSA